MDTQRTITPSSSKSAEERLALYQRQLSPVASLQQLNQSSSANHSTTTMARDPITCHVLNTLTGTPAANLPCTLTLLSNEPYTFKATTDSDGRIKTWSASSKPGAGITVSNILADLPSPDSKSNWSIRFDVGPWFESQGIESFWPEVEVKFTVRGRGVEGLDGWRHYHVPVLLGPWSYSTYRGS